MLGATVARMPFPGASFLRGELSSESSGRSKALPLGLWKVDATLPDGGLPRGAVVEIASPSGLARATSMALAACAAAQAEAQLRAGKESVGAWCAWVDASLSLFAPAVVRAGVDLDRLLIVQPPPEELARVAVRVAASRAFSVVVVDLAGVPGKRLSPRLDRWVNPVRRLALAMEGSEATTILLTDTNTPRALPLPVTLRLELERSGLDRLSLRVAKERRGRVGAVTTLALSSVTPSSPHMGGTMRPTHARGSEGAPAMIRGGEAPAPRGGEAPLERKSA